MEERREFERSKIPPLTVEIDRIESGKGFYEHVKLVIEEVSEEGMRLWASVPFEQGEMIRFELAALEMDAIIEGCVSWTRRDEDGGCYCGLHLINQ